MHSGFRDARRKCIVGLEMGGRKCIGDFEMGGRKCTGGFGVRGRKLKGARGALWEAEGKNMADGEEP